MKRYAQETIYFAAAKRTPFGSFLGSLAGLTATDLGYQAAKSALASINLDPGAIDHVIFGNVLQTAKDAIYLARHIGLRCEIPHRVPALGLNRLCGSGFEVVVQGARLLANNEAQAVLVGGSESLSQAPHVIRGARSGIALGHSKMEDSLWECLHDTYVNLPMALTAEKLAELYHINQEQVDNYALRSQMLYFDALKQHKFLDELAPLQWLQYDEHPRLNTSLEALKKLPKVFKKDGVIHAAAASGICDGAAALIMCTESFIAKHQLKALGELISFGISGCDPSIMGIGPVPAIKQCLAKAELDLSDISMIEINEAFAPQVLAVQLELNLDINKLNIHGGALAIGHPLAASGARITTHLLHSLKNQPGALGLGSACIGGGQGIAVLIRSI